MRWATAKMTAAVSAAFIVVNSVAGLAGQLHRLARLSASASAVWVPVAIVGGFAGARFGARAQNSRVMCVLLAVVLGIAVIKLVATTLG